jgi:hypothetical protein
MWGGEPPKRRDFLIHVSKSDRREIMSMFLAANESMICLLDEESDYFGDTIAVAIDVTPWPWSQKDEHGEISEWIWGRRLVATTLTHESSLRWLLSARTHR